MYTLAADSDRDFLFALSRLALSLEIHLVPERVTLTVATRRELMLIPIVLPRLPTRTFTELHATPTEEPGDGPREAYALLYARDASAVALLGAGLSQMGTPSVVARTPLDAILQLSRLDIRFGVVFVSLQGEDFEPGEFLTFLEELYPRVGRVVIAAHGFGAGTTVWAQPAPVSSQTWRDSDGDSMRSNWRLRFSGSVSQGIDATLI